MGFNSAFKGLIITPNIIGILEWFGRGVLSVYHEIIQYKDLCLLTVTTFICDYTNNVLSAQSMNSTVRLTLASPCIIIQFK